MKKLKEGEIKITWPFATKGICIEIERLYKGETQKAIVPIKDLILDYSGFTLFAEELFTKYKI